MHVERPPFVHTLLLLLPTSTSTNKMPDFSYSVKKSEFSLDVLPELQLVLDELEKLETYGCISHNAFNIWLSRHISPTSKSIPVFHRVFKTLDDAGSFSVGTHDLACALMPFCPGSKSDKLSRAFGLYSAENDSESGSGTGANDGEDVISIRALWLILRAFSASLSIIAKFSIPSHEVAVLTVSKISGFYKKQKFISLEDLSNWYAFCGTEISCWFELLDHKKWYGAEVVVPVHSALSTTSTSTASDLEPDVQSSNAVVNTLSQHELTVCSRLMAKTALRFNTYYIDFNAAWSYPNKSELIESECKSYFKHILKADDVFCTRFAKFLYQNCDVKSFASIAVASSMLFEGRKTSKLKKYFERLNRNNDRGDSSMLLILRKDLYDILETIYQTIHFLTFRPYVSTVADRRTFEHVTRIATSGEHKGLVSFSEFGDWYNEEGFYILSWLELLNPMKLANKFLV